jgi:hypothetical protein
MAEAQDDRRLLAERLVEIFAEAHGRPPADADELDAFVEREVRAAQRHRAAARRVH